LTRLAWAGLVLAGLLFTALVPGPAPAGAGRDWPSAVRRLAGSGGVAAADGQGRLLFGHNPDKKLVPASILKIVTAGAGLSSLGSDFRFKTEFRLARDGDLIISGRGDPLLVSEEVESVARDLKSRGLAEIRDIVLDNSYFASGLVLDGTSRSLNPYDAFTGALAVNFNTIKVVIGPQGKVAPAETQTPLTPIARRMARGSGARGEVRLNLAQDPALCLLYAGELFRAFLERAGVEVRGRIRPLGPGRASGRLVLRHCSSFDLAQVVARMMKYSNNFMANQLFLTLGAEMSGPPADEAKARRAVEGYLARLGRGGVHLEEGSGLSRKTRLSAALMVRVLEDFRPHLELLTETRWAGGKAWVKTGTLAGVQSLAGYLESPRGGAFPFAVILNGENAQPGRRERIMRLLAQGLGEGKGG